MNHFQAIKKWSEERGFYSENVSLLDYLKHIETEIQECKDSNNNDEFVGELSDIIVFCINAMYHNGYDAEVVIDETVKKLNSRTGSFCEKSKKMDKNRYHIHP